MSGAECKKDVIEGARKLYAAAVKRRKGKQSKPRLDKGVEKKRQSKSETTFLQKKKLSVQKAILKSNQSLSSSTPRTATATMEDLQLSAKGMKELQLQKKRRLGRAVEAAEHGYLLKTDDVGQQAFSDLAKKKMSCEAKDNKRMEAMARRNSEEANKCSPQPWNFKSLGARKTWCNVGLRLLVLPLVHVSEARRYCFFDK